MKLIAHRRNTIAELCATDPRYGIEIDLRSRGSDLILQHDPFIDGESLTEWLEHYRHSTLILNVKEEGLEARLLALMAQKGIADFFFLDQSFPFLIKWSKAGERRCAVRVSEYETVDTALALAGQVAWAWIDCFTRFPLSQQDGQRLHDAGFQLCIVSPELQGRSPDSEIPALARLLRERAIAPAAVCTKRPELWEQAV